MPLPKLGKQAARYDKRTLIFRDYLLPQTAIQPPKPALDWTPTPDKDYYKPWPMFGNDTLGDCVPAATGHQISSWDANAQKPAEVTDADVLKMYEIVGGYVPGNPSTDNGCVMLDALNYWRRQGIGGHKITAFATLEPASELDIQDAVWLFGGAYIGLQLPISAQGASSWFIPQGGPVGDGAPGSWGGHCVPILGYSPRGLTVITWGAPLQMSWNFYKTYSDEAYAIISPDWIEKNAEAPNNFNLGQLQKDLAAL